MTITISEQCYFELLQEEKKIPQVDPTDCFDLTEPYPKLLGQGYYREIELRDGLFLEIFDCQLSDRVIWKLPERHEHLSYHFHQKSTLDCIHYARTRRSFYRLSEATSRCSILC
jgi:hypothetical protein